VHLVATSSRYIATLVHRNESSTASYQPAWRHIYYRTLFLPPELRRTKAPYRTSFTPGLSCPRYMPTEGGATPSSVAMSLANERRSRYLAPSTECAALHKDRLFLPSSPDTFPIASSPRGTRTHPCLCLCLQDLPLNASLNV